MGKPARHGGFAASGLTRFTYLGMTQLMAGGGIVLIGTQLVPLLAGLFTTT